MQKQIKVLMLGWEYPPLLTGGLGQACFGLAKALGQAVSLTLVIPRKPVDAPQAPVSLVGLNQVDYRRDLVAQIEKRYEKTLKIRYFEAYYELYPVGEMKQRREEAEEEWIEIEETHTFSPSKALFDEEQVYGPRIMDKVAAYTRIVTDLALEMDFDVVHAHDWLTFPAAMRIKELTGKPFVAHIHSLEVDRVGDYRESPVYQIEQAALTAANYVLAVSQYTRNMLSAHYKLDIRKVFIIHNGIDSELPTVPARPKQEGQKKKILFLGRVTRQKGPTFLVETALHLIKKYPNVVFVVAGIGDRLRATMQHVRNRKLFEHFEFVGFLDRQQVAEMLAEADAYFMPSVSEPFGLAALEAANAQVPVVVSKQAGINEALPDLLKADYWDTEKFANYLYALLSYPALSAEMNRLTASQVSNLTWEKAAEDIVYLYQQLREGTTA